MDAPLVKAEFVDNINAILQYCEESKGLLDGKFQEQNTNREERKQSLSISSRNIDQGRASNSKQVSKTGNFVRIEGAKFDIILNILIGIRRSLSTLVHLPGQELTDWQFKKKTSSESDWIDQSLS